MAKIHGKSSFDKHRMVELDLGGGEIVTARMTYPPFDFGESLQERIPLQPCRQIPLRDGKGVVFDRNNGKPIWYDDPTDLEAFQSRETEIELLRGLMGFVQLLDDPNWEFDTTPPPLEGYPKGAWLDYAKKIRAELREVGFTAIGYRSIAKAMGEMGGMTETEVAKAAEGFTPGTAGTPDSETEGGPSSTPTRRRRTTRRRCSTRTTRTTSAPGTR